MRYLKENTATLVTVGPFYDVTDGITPEVALGVTGIHITTVVDDAGVPVIVVDALATASAGDNDMVHIASDIAGYYSLELTAANLNYTGRMVLSCHDTSEHLPVFHEFQIIAANVYDSLFTDGDVLDVSAVQILGGAIPTPAVTGIPDVNTLYVGDTIQTANDNGADINTLITQVGTAGDGLTAITGVSLAADQAVDATKFGGAAVTATTSVTFPSASTVATTTGAVASVTGAVGSVAGNVDGSVATLTTLTAIPTDWLTAAGTAADFTTEIQSGYTAQTGDTYALLNSADSEPAQGAPVHTASLAVKIATMFKFMVNKKLATNALISVLNSDESTVDHKAIISDDATTYTEGEYKTGP
jgi:hypothetical protein